jgi:hypothetical protein
MCEPCRRNESKGYIRVNCAIHKEYSLTCKEGDITEIGSVQEWPSFYCTEYEKEN